MGQLIGAGEPPVERCTLCGKPGSGPCARCRRLVCADCCVLTTGAAATFAVCLRCEARGAPTLRPAWLGLLGWLAAVLAALVAIAALVALVANRP